MAGECGKGWAARLRLRHVTVNRVHRRKRREESERCSKVNRIGGLGLVCFSVG